MNIFTHSIDTVSEFLGKLMAWLTLIMVILMALVVILRYGFDIGMIAMQETIIYLHAMVFLLGAAYTLKYNEHVRVDVFYRQFTAKQKAIVDCCGHLFLLLPVVCFIAYMSWSYVAASWQIMEQSVEVGGLPLVYLLKSMILLFCLSLALQGLAEVGKAYSRYKTIGTETK